MKGVILIPCLMFICNGKNNRIGLSVSIISEEMVFLRIVAVYMQLTTELKFLCGERS